MAAMMSHRASVTIPARERHREPGPSLESSRPPAPRAEARANRGVAPAARQPAPPAEHLPKVDGGPVEVAEGYLAPALKAAAAARARTAQIRAAAWAAAAGPAWPYPRERPAAFPDHLQAAPSAAALSTLPALAHELPLAEMAAAWAMRGLTIDGATGLPALPAGAEAPAHRGLSVTEAASASRISFRPLLRPLPAGLAPPAAESPTGAAPLAAGKAVAPAAKAAVAPELRGIASAPSGAGTPVTPPAPVKAVTRPGIARLLPGDGSRARTAARGPTPRRGRAAAR
jgi:hypothetical protein